jgi:hypothetical protein
VKPPMPSHLSSPERINALHRCWETRRLREGLIILFGPLRSAAYRLRKQANNRTRRADKDFIRVGAAPPFPDNIHPVFVNAVTPLGVTDGVSSLFADVEKQIAGVFRLAGGSYCRVDSACRNQWDDPEQAHSYNRLYWAVRYAQAAALGHPAALKALRRDWKIWQEQVSNSDVHVAAPYTVSERICSLVEVLFWTAQISSPVTGQLASSIKSCIWEDACRLAATIEYGLGVHNHLLNNARALFQASAALQDCAEAASWRRLAFKIWDAYFPELVLPDGVFVEQSSHYHLLLCRTALEYTIASRRSDHSLPEGFEGTVRAMFRLANELLRADGTLPRFGDNSPDHIVEDLWGLLAAAHYHGLLDETPRHTAITPLTVYYCGLMPDLPCGPAITRSRFYPEGGFAFLSSSLHRAELVVHVDPRPEAQAHGDSGQGSFELWWRGQVLIREPGSFLKSGCQKSDWYRSGAANNVTCLNGLAPGISWQDRQFLPNWYCCQKRSPSTSSSTSLQFICETFRRLRSDLTLLRSWTFEEDGSLVFEEQIHVDEQTKPLRFESRLCLGDGRWELDTGARAIRWTGAGQSAVRMTLDIPARVTASIMRGGYVPEYGIEKPATVLLLKGRPELPLRWRWRCEFLPAGLAVQESNDLLLARASTNRRTTYGPLLSILPKCAELLEYTTHRRRPF